MAAAPLPPLNWVCPTCGVNVPAGQNCPNCGPAAGAPAPQPPQPQPPRPRVPRLAPAPQPQPAPPAGGGAPPQPPPPPAAVPHGTRQQYTHPVQTNRGRDENWIAHGLFIFFLWISVLGSMALLSWLVFGSYQWGWHANPCKPPCGVSAPAPTTAPARRPSPAPSRQSTRSATPAAPQQPAVDLTPVERGLNRIADSLSSQPAAEPTRETYSRRPTPEGLDDATARWLEGQQDP